MSDALRIAEEAQLLAEEKWLIETLTQVRNQRNRVHIERLHLQTLAAEYENLIHDKKETKSHSQAELSTCSVSPGHQATQGAENVQHNQVHSQLYYNLDEATGEKLDLSVSRSVFNQDFRESMAEEYEEDDLEDASEKVLLDINMLMNLS